MNRSTLLVWGYGCVALLYALFYFLHISASFTLHPLRKSFTLCTIKIICTQTLQLTIMSLTGHLTQNATSNSTDLFYELLFCDNILLYQLNATEPDTYPWNILFAEDCNPRELQRIIDNPNLETRMKLLAYHKLRTESYLLEHKALLAVIVEVGLDEGVDVLASYKDGSARYINQSGNILIWETTDENSDALTQQLFADSEQVLPMIGPWDQPRRPQPEKGYARISFLVSDGLYFGEAPINVLFNDKLASPALQSATALMQYLTAFALRQSN